jgi:peptidoglycan hydrolase-like protein with peptidoglycan-binding domain
MHPVQACINALGLVLLLSAPSMAQDSSMSQNTSTTATPSPVTAVQQKLNELGYEAGPNDGLMGPRTRAAIRRFQTDAGLPVTGRIDKELLAQLESYSAQAPFVDDPAVVQRLEEKLDSLGWAVGAIDGQIDDQLRIALSKYTRFAGLPVRAEPTMAMVTHIEQNQVCNVAETASKLLWQVEMDLAQRGYRTGPIDGTTDPFTFRAMLDYEEDNDLPRNGQLNPILLDSLEIPDTRPVTATDIGEIQRHLATRGYAAGAAEGVVDAETEAAIKAYQADAGHVQTGRPTLILLDELSRSPTVSENFVSQHGTLPPGYNPLQAMQ